MSPSRGFGVAAGLDPAVAGPVAARCAELGYGSLWSNDHPGALGLETLAAFAPQANHLHVHDSFGRPTSIDSAIRSMSCS